MFNYLVRSVMEHGVELWGWEEKKNLEKVMMDYIRWCFRLDFCTPRYLITRDLGIEKLKIRWGSHGVGVQSPATGRSRQDSIRVDGEAGP